MSLGPQRTANAMMARLETRRASARKAETTKNQTRENLGNPSEILGTPGSLRSSTEPTGIPGVTRLWLTNGSDNSFDPRLGVFAMCGRALFSFLEATMQTSKRHLTYLYGHHRLGAATGRAPTGQRQSIDNLTSPGKTPRPHHGQRRSLTSDLRCPFFVP